MKHILHYIFLWTWVSCPLLAWSQEYSKFDVLTIDDGLSQNTANCFLQDNLGFMWVGTQEGLNLYDGVKFNIFQRTVGDTTSLTDDYVLCLFEDSQRNVWVGTEDGLNRFDRSKQRFRTFKASKKPHALHNATITAITEDKKGFIWVATEGGLFRFDPKTEQFKDFSVLPIENTIRKMAISPSDHLWLGTEKGLFEFDINTSEIKQQLYPDENIRALHFDLTGDLWIATNEAIYKKYARKSLEHTVLKDFTINHFALDERNQVMWVGTEAGLLRYDLANKKIKVIQHNPAHVGGITTNSILTVYVDKAGVLWLGTNALGINRLDEKRIKFKQYFYHKQTAEGTKIYLFIRSIWQDRFGYLWVGTNKGLYKTNRKNNKTVSFPPMDETTVAPIFEDSKGNIWVGTSSMGLFKYKNDRDTIDFDQKKFKNYVAGENSIGSNHIRVVFEDSGGKIWIGTDRGGVAIYRPDTDDFEQIRHDSKNPKSLPNDRIRGIFEDRDKDIWISTYGGGLALLESKNAGKAQFKIYRNNYADSTTISTDRVYPMHQTPDGTLWVLTSGGGLNRLDKKTGKFKTYTQREGLPNNVLYAVLPDSKGFLWFSTNLGLSKFDPKNEVFKNYTVEDGLQSNEFNAGAGFKNKQGELFFGGIKGLNYFNPDSVMDNKYIPPIAFTDFKIANHSVPISDDDDAIIKEHISLAKKLYLPKSQNSFSLEFAALHFSNPKQNRYKYKLEGFDPDWIYPDEGRANYTNLDYGEYVFKVHGTNADGVWNEQGIGLVIVIKPAWYETFWARALGIISLILASYGFYRWRVRRIEYKKQQLERLVAQRTVQLELQKREIEEQAERLQAANDQIIHTSDEIDKKNKDITASIVYASRIQKAIMPKLSDMRRAFPKGYFRFFKPRDIVSGDFYWFAQVENKLILAVADCTGHGVPGAFMSMAGDAWLDQIVNGRDIVRPDLILNELHRITKKALKQDIAKNIDDSTARDGMDIALCAIDSEKHILEYAGAKNPLVYIQNGKSTLIKGDKSTIGGIYTENEYHFTLHTLILGAETACYMFSDGFQDQFGGKTGRKFSIKRLEELLLSIHDQPSETQLEIIGQVFEDWRAGSRQIDDILLIGFKW